MSHVNTCGDWVASRPVRRGRACVPNVGDAAQWRAAPRPPAAPVRVRDHLERSPVTFRDLVDLLDSRVAARFAVLRLAIEGGCDVLPRGPLTNAAVIVSRAAAPAGCRS